MTPGEKIISEASKYMIPSVEDYLAARCLLLNNIFVGLTSAHEAVEKIMKALIILEGNKPPRGVRGHELKNLEKILLQKNSVRYKFLNKHSVFLGRLDGHYAWRYYDNQKKRSRNKSPEDLYPLDDVYITLYECYINFLSEKYRFGSYLITFLFNEEMKQYVNWGDILAENNNAILDKVDIWRKGFEEYLKNPPTLTTRPPDKPKS